MSYEGYEEYLCENGHYMTANCYDSVWPQCRSCGHSFSHWHAVDQTNGTEENNPNTMPAPKEEIGFEDVWQEDHYGNKYATKIILYRPLSEWKEVLASDVAGEVPTLDDELNTEEK